MNLPARRTSSDSGHEENCAEVADTRDYHHIRDSKLITGPILACIHAQRHS